MWGVDRMDQKVSAYMINLHTLKWWWPLFQFSVDVSVNNAYQIYRQSHLNPGEYKLDALLRSPSHWRCVPLPVQKEFSICNTIHM